MKKYRIYGMSCAACSAAVERAVRKVKGVEECSVNLLTQSMSVTGSISDEDIINAVRKAGYDASPGEKKEETKKERSEVSALMSRLISSVIMLIILMYFSMLHPMLGFPLPGVLAQNSVATGLVQLLLTVAIMIINRKFFINGFKGLFHLSPNMDSLVALGASASFIYSVVILFMMILYPDRFSGNSFYFESAGMILTLVTVGKTLESYSKGKTTDALRELMEISPKTATLIIDGEEREVDIHKVQVGDIFVVRPGEKIPVDAVIIEGETGVDQSSLTGESMPVDKKAGDSVSAASNNLYGYIRCRATGVGEDTSIARIIKTVREATATKAPIAKIADRVSGVFVPAVIIIALITFGVWMIIGKGVAFSLARAISVLVISCPCALGLATPVAIMVGSGVGAKNGVLFKTARALEIAGRGNIAVFDKTGTITTGEPEVTDIIDNGTGKEELLSLAYSLEAMSEHPLSKAIVKKAAEEKAVKKEIENFRAVFGKGVEGKIEKCPASGGKLEYISSFCEIPEDMKKIHDELSQQGKTPLLFSKDGRFFGIIAVTDKIKQDSAEAVKEIKKMGFKTVMLTGDNEKTAQEIARQAGIDSVIAGALPEEKGQYIRELKETGKVIMVGDGINDAPALALADVGIAVGAGTDVAVDSGEIVLINSRLSDVAFALKLSRATLRNIKQNLFWAFFYNSLGIPLAAGVFISAFGWEMNPMFGAAAMSVSSVFVVLNALRLNLFKGKKTTLPPEKEISREEIKENIILEKTVYIDGMMCGHCEERVRKSIEDITGVISVTASCAKGTAVIKSEREISDDEIGKAVENAGYEMK